MRITLRYIVGCPNLPVVEARLCETLAQVGARAEIIHERLETPAEAERLGFRGSPTVLIEGRDPFADEDTPVGLACRIYQTETGPQGSPSVAQLRAAIRR